ncbi:hypothetical protein LINPERHAP2_LOCUS3333, partial [Linum perenne]
MVCVLLESFYTNCTFVAQGPLVGHSLSIG